MANQLIDRKAHHATFQTRQRENVLLLNKLQQIPIKPVFILQKRVQENGECLTANRLSKHPKIRYQSCLTHAGNYFTLWICKNIPWFKDANGNSANPEYCLKPREKVIS